MLPFRVTTADTLLGEGFAELLATEFTGEGGPRAVDMATVLSAWRRAGGGLRSPLPRAEAVRLARDLGAGLVSEGSIVGLGGRVTVTASLVSVADGTARGAGTRVAGSPDSLDVLLRRAATSLLASVGAQSRQTEGARFTDSPSAMRHYLEGLSSWRRGRLSVAARSFERAIAEDSSFVQAMFRRYMAAFWGAGGGGAQYARLTWEHRERLPRRERIVLEGVLGAEYPRSRPVEQRMADRQSAVRQLPDSPEALYYLGDYYYHYGSPIDPVNQLRLAREHLERAAGIDSQATVLRHLVEIGLTTRDTALLRRVWPAYERTEDPGRSFGLWLVGATLGDQSLLAMLRRRSPDEGSSDFAGGWAANSSVRADVPMRLLDEMAYRWLATPTSTENRRQFALFLGGVMAMRGRPEAAKRRWAGLPQVGVDLLRLQLALAGLVIATPAESVAARLAATAGDGEEAASGRCLAALWRAQADTTQPDGTPFREAYPRCAWALDVVRLTRTRSPEADRLLAEADSTLRNSLAFDLAGFEGRLLARAWETRGDISRALAAIRLRVYGSALSEGCCWLEEGRLAALAGDTAGAVSAYRNWLAIMRDTEPALAPRVDSATTALRRLEASDR